MNGVQRIHDNSGALALADQLNGNQRSRPTVVVTTPAGRDTPYIDVALLAQEVSDFADIVVITTGTHTWTFSKAMPDLTQVYGGAGRVYPVGTAWVRDPRESPLRFAYDQGQGRRATDDLIADAERMAAQAGLFDRAVQATPPVRFTGTVAGFPHPERALVKAGHVLATVIPELAQPGVALERLLKTGMSVTGLLDRTTRRLDLRGSTQSRDTALEGYQPGRVVMARVSSVAVDAATLELFPGVVAEVERSDVTSNPLDSLDDLMTVGEVLPARVTKNSPEWRLSLLDVDDDEEPLPAASVFAGGPPWLVETATAEMTAEAAPAPAPDVVEPEELDLDSLVLDEPAPEPAPGPPAPSPLLLDRKRPRPPSRPHPVPAPRAEKGAVRDLSLTVAALKRRNESQASEIADLTNERNQLSHRLQEVERDQRRREAEVAKLKAQLRKAGKASATAWSAPEFADREQGFRFAVTGAWASRTPKAEQAARPLVHYTLGPEFLDSLDRLEGVKSTKVADVVFEIVTGLVRDLAGRDAHQLRQGAAGNAPYVRRASDGAVCWRAALQVNTPSARRIHYWVLPGGEVELSRVCLHDEMGP